MYLYYFKYVEADIPPNTYTADPGFSKHASNEFWSHVPRRQSAMGPTAAPSWWRHQMETFSAYWPFVREIHRSPVNSPHKGQWRGALKFSLICAWINGSVNNREVGDLRRHRAHYDVTVMEDWYEG